MIARPPSALHLSADRKHAAVIAVDRAIGIIGEQMARREQLESDIRPEQFAWALKSISSHMALFSTVVMLIVGRSQQPYLKGRNRQWEVRLESYKIAAETGASLEDVYETFMSLMPKYIRPR